MTAYVRVRKHEDLVACIDDTGTQVDVAAASGVSVQRINQIYTGTHLVLEVRKARSLEDALGVPHGSLFEAVDAALLAPYLHADDPDSDPDSEAGESSDEAGGERDKADDPGAVSPASAA